MGAIPSGKGGERFPQLPPPKRPDLEGSGGGAAVGDELLLLWAGRSEGKKGRVGEKRPARAQDIGLVAPARMARQLVAPMHVTRQRGPRQRRRGAALARAASVATLSRHMHWHDKGYLSRHARWRDQTGYALQIKTNTD